MRDGRGGTVTQAAPLRGVGAVRSPSAGSAEGRRRLPEGSDAAGAAAEVTGGGWESRRQRGGRPKPLATPREPSGGLWVGDGQW